MVSRRVFEEGSSSAAEAQVFLYQHGQMVLQLDGEGNDPLSEENLSHRYLWGPGVDMLLADEQVTSLATAGEVL
jgi:hypothetical protein